MKMRFLRYTLCVLIFILIVTVAAGREYHVWVNSSDHNKGSVSDPLKTHSAAATIAQPGDVITVYEGI